MSGGPVVAVTGATGFLGLHLVRALAAQGARVRILARRDPTHEFWRGCEPAVVRGNLDDAPALDRLVAGADAVVHGAGLIKSIGRADFMRVNRDGTRNVALAARRGAPAARFVAISSLAARAPHLSDYAASKQAGEQAAHAAYDAAPGRLVILRPPAVYGPWDRETLAIFKAASRPIVPVFGAGRAALVHASDAAATIARCALGGGDAGTFAIADDRPSGYSMRELLGEAASAVGGKPRFLPIPDRLVRVGGALSEFWGRIGRGAPMLTSGKARELLHPDWSVTAGELAPEAIHRPAIGIGEGFRDTVAWYRAAGWLR